MLTQIKGLHHVTSIASDAVRNNAFFTDALGLRRVKKTVNFDSPDVYHLYYGDEQGTPGTVMTHFPFARAARGRPGTGEVGETVFAVPQGSLDFWADRLADRAEDLARVDHFGESRLSFRSDDGEAFALSESADDNRDPWTGNGVGADHAIRGFRGATMRLADTGAMAELLTFMGYQKSDTRDGVTRYVIEGGNPADTIDLAQASGVREAQQGAGSVHHIAFAVEDRAAQLAVRRALTDTGHAVTPVIDRDYFWAIYFRTPGGVLFEIATNEPGFDRDEDTAHLGEALKLPSQHEHLRSALEGHLQPLG
ncbi:VOC family protein [Loktanella sp. SALINAS62]|uniref:VOC family protein n=1 Tax=Loktanella sp. SALINAS62 TaxID=2706124 RepID=UPI001B8AEB88|nr:VOC family protein [Loktanella sp. SALINAS62]MBS1301059.1 ring-cleaving dioxygenase [Loktanella sp. SALINAS62]